MTPAPLAGAAAVGLLLLAGPQTEMVQTPQVPVFRSVIGIVVIQATVRNERGEAVTGLERDAFTVYENGKAQDITAFSRGEVPVSLGIALDQSASMRFSRPRSEAAARALAGASNPQDESFLLRFADRPVMEVPFTSDRGALEAQIGRGPSIGGTALRDAVLAGEAYLVDHGLRDRRVLVVVSDGCDNSSVASRDEVRELARRSQVVVHAIGLLPDEDHSKSERGRDELEALCLETGGLVYYPRASENASAIALELAHQIRSQYTIAYSPANQTLDGSYRKIQVVAKGPGRLSVRTRTGYRAITGRTSGPKE